MKETLFPKIKDTLLALDVNAVPENRKAVLQPLIAYIQSKADRSEAVRLNFICTHNSRRSHLSQAWAQALAAYVGLPKVCCYSGGTEATALFPLVADTLQQHGFEVTLLADGENPVYALKTGENEHPVVAFSKTYDHPFNPASDFAAILTCSQADEGCPFIAGAEQRIPVTYNDPKAFDGTPRQAEKYRESSLQIASELLYVFTQIAVK